MDQRDHSVAFSKIKLGKQKTKWQWKYIRNWTEKYLRIKTVQSEMEIKGQKRVPHKWLNWAPGRMVTILLGGWYQLGHYEFNLDMLIEDGFHLWIQLWIYYSEGMKLQIQNSKCRYWLKWVNWYSIKINTCHKTLSCMKN